jgi:hypothetical protein
LSKKLFFEKKVLFLLHKWTKKIFVMERKFILSDVLRVSWKGLISQIWLLAGLLIGYVIVSLALTIFIPAPMQGTISPSGLVIAFFSLVLSLLFSLGYIQNMFQTLDGEEPQFSAYGQQARKIITFLVAGLIYGVIIIVGLALLVLPGIYLAIRLQFYLAAIVEEDTGIVASLKRSWKITKGQTKPLVLLLLVIIGFTVLGLAFFGVGIFVTYPLAGLMYCCAFRKLTTFST